MDESGYEFLKRWHWVEGSKEQSAIWLRWGTLRS